MDVFIVTQFLSLENIWDKVKLLALLWAKANGLFQHFSLNALYVEENGMYYCR